MAGHGEKQWISIYANDPLEESIVTWLQPSRHAADSLIRLIRCHHQFQKLRSHLDHKRPFKRLKCTKLHLADSNSTSSSTSDDSGCPSWRRMSWCAPAYPRPLLCIVGTWSTLPAPSLLPIVRCTYASKARNPFTQWLFGNCILPKGGCCSCMDVTSLDGSEVTIMECARYFFRPGLKGGPGPIFMTPF